MEDELHLAQFPENLYTRTHQKDIDQKGLTSFLTQLTYLLFGLIFHPIGLIQILGVISRHRGTNVIAQYLLENEILVNTIITQLQLGEKAYSSNMR